MILRDAHGEIEVPFCEDFEYRSNVGTLAKLTVVCPAAEYSTPMNPVLWVRLTSGAVERDGKRVGISPDGKRPLFTFTGELVASLVRQYRLGGLSLEPAAVQQPARSVPKERRAKPSKERDVQDQPTTESLF